MDPENPKPAATKSNKIDYQARKIKVLIAALVIVFVTSITLTVCLVHQKKANQWIIEERETKERTLQKQLKQLQSQWKSESKGADAKCQELKKKLNAFEATLVSVEARHKEEKKKLTGEIQDAVTSNALKVEQIKRLEEENRNLKASNAGGGRGGYRHGGGVGYGRGSGGSGGYRQGSGYGQDGGRAGVDPSLPDAGAGINQSRRRGNRRNRH